MLMSEFSLWQVKSGLVGFRARTAGPEAQTTSAPTPAPAQVVTLPRPGPASFVNRDLFSAQRNGQKLDNPLHV
jgi:hypothetical protein